MELANHNEVVEQHAAIAHTDNCGVGRPEIKKAAEQRTAVAHSVSYGKTWRCDSQTPVGAIENRALKIHFFRFVRGLNDYDRFVPTVSTVGYYRSLLRSALLWPTRTRIC